MKSIRYIVVLIVAMTLAPAYAEVRDSIEGGKGFWQDFEYEVNAGTNIGGTSPRYHIGIGAADESGNYEISGYGEHDSFHVPSYF